MRSRYRIHEGGEAYFITATIVDWLPVFATAGCCDVLVKSLLHCREHKKLQIHAWVILDNHFHAILSGPDLAKTVRDLKRFTGRTLVEQIRSERRDWLLERLAVSRAEYKTASEHQVWQEGVHPQALESDEVWEQKLDYIHNNPVKRGWVAGPEHWRYSSAHEWLVGATPVFRVDRCL